MLQSPYKANTPLDVAGEFPTTDQRGVGAFFSQGLDVGIFRQVFGKFTGSGQVLPEHLGNESFNCFGFKV